MNPILKNLAAVGVTLASFACGWKLVGACTNPAMRPAVVEQKISSKSDPVSLPDDLARVPAEFTEGMPGTLAEIIAETRPVQRLLGLMALAGSGSKTELQSMLRAGREDSSVMHFFSDRLAQDDPQGLYDWLIAERARIGGSWTQGDYLNEVRATLFSKWAGNNPAEAFAHMSDQDTHSFFQSIGQANPERYWSYLQEAIKAGLTQASLPEAVWLKQPERAMAELAKLPAGKIRESCLAQFASQYAMHDPKAALQWWQQLPPQDHSRQRDLICNALAENEPVLALQAMESIPYGLKSEATRTAATKWLEQDTPAAWAWVNQHLTGSLRRELLSDFFGKFATKDPAMAMIYLQQLPMGRFRQELDTSLQNWLERQAEGLPGQ
jgi:hypothetical protein